MSRPGRKIKLPDYYCPHPYEYNMDPKCDHDYEPEPEGESDHGAHWRCIRCQGVVTFDVWD